MQENECTGKRSDVPEERGAQKAAGEYRVQHAVVKHCRLGVADNPGERDQQQGHAESEGQRHSPPGGAAGCLCRKWFVAIHRAFVQVESGAPGYAGKATAHVT